LGAAGQEAYRKAALRVARAAGSEGSHRERSDVADFIKHVRQLQAAAPGTEAGQAEGGYERLPDGEAVYPFARQTSWCDAEARRNSAPEVSEERRRLCVPGGFRRQHLHAKADAEGLPDDERPDLWSQSLMEYLFPELMEERAFGLATKDGLFGPSAHKGLSNFGIAAAVFKGNIGSNVLFMPHAWQQAGFVCGLGMTLAVAFISVVCVFRIIDCRALSGRESYGELMERSVGRSGRAAVDLCIVLLQCGSCCSYLVNVANILRRTIWPFAETWLLITCAAAVVTPLVLIRNVAKLSPVNVLGGLLMLLGLALTFVAIGSSLEESGMAPIEAVTHNPDGWLVCLGIVCFAFDGIGLALPIYDSCRDPASFRTVYAATVGAIVVLLCSMSALGYSAFGAETNTLVVLNLEQGTGTKVIQVIFCLVVLTSFPLQMLPAIRIVEGLFLSPSRPKTWDKHIKNLVRLACVALVAGVSILAATSLDHFVSIVGAVCGLPLAFIFPAMCHKKLVATPGSAGVGVDWALIVFGVLIMVVVGTENVMTWGG